MKLSRELVIPLHWLLNEMTPPALRDCKWFMKPALWFFFRDKAPIFEEFHRQVYTMSDAEFQRINAEIQSVILERETDINKKCLTKILGNIRGKTVLDAGCGRGYLVRRLAERGFTATGVDVALDNRATADKPDSLTLIESPLETLPFEDSQFDTVVCAHTLEHARNLPKALAELRRVCKQRLIVVLPCERPYKYHFSLHIHFFPYDFSVLAVLGTDRPYTLEKLGGDWVYIEDNESV